jgi:hypothetical protein
LFIFTLPILTYFFARLSHSLIPDQVHLVCAIVTFLENLTNANPRKAQVHELNQQQQQKSIPTATPKSTTTGAVNTSTITKFQSQMQNAKFKSQIIK